MAERVARRTVLAGTVAAAAVSVVGVVPTAAAAPLTSHDSDEELLLHVAGTVAVLPVAFPAFDELGTAKQRVTKKRLQQVLSRMSDDVRGDLVDGLAQVRTMLSVRDDEETVVRAFGRAAASSAQVRGLLAVVSAAIATISSRFEPGQRPAAELWLDYARRFAAMPARGREAGAR
ncbi:hypothetical protein [Amycolatopsis rubida]|nr:hypothetical protein [Amycolatopsis rubida]